jgi:hypothetical protein
VPAVQHSPAAGVGTLLVIVIVRAAAQLPNGNGSRGCVMAATSATAGCTAADGPCLATAPHQHALCLLAAGAAAHAPTPQLITLPTLFSSFSYLLCCCRCCCHLQESEPRHGAGAARLRGARLLCQARTHRRGSAPGQAANLHHLPSRLAHLHAWRMC